MKKLLFLSIVLLSVTGAHAGWGSFGHALSDIGSAGGTYQYQTIGKRVQSPKGTTQKSNKASRKNLKKGSTQNSYNENKSGSDLGVSARL